MKRFVIDSILLALLCGTVSRAQTITVTFSELGFHITPEAINNAGTIGGQGNDLQATVVTARGQIVKLGLEGDIFAISEAGDAAVSGFVGGIQHCLRWSARGGPVVLTPWLTFDASCLATGINSRGEVTGSLDVQFQDQTYRRSFRWGAQGEQIELGTLGGNTATAFDINERGDIVGSSETTAGKTQAFRWTSATGMQRLPLPVSDSSSVLSAAMAINNQGDIAGYILLDSQPSLLVVWRADGRIITAEAPQYGSQPHDINELGVVVGDGFIWKPGESLIEISGNAYAINERDVIVGHAPPHDGGMWVIER
jgi:probable HAF family extracellular repeat protein